MKKPRTKTSELFAQTLRHVWNGSYFDTHIEKCRHICCAADFCDNPRVVRNIIQKRLGGAPTVKRWLVARGYISEDFWHNRTFDKKIQEYRIAWVKSLIEEFKSRGS